jgi:hypothetical protein
MIKEEKERHEQIRSSITKDINKVKEKIQNDEQIIDDLYNIYINHVYDKDTFINYDFEFLKNNFNDNIKKKVNAKITKKNQSKYPKIDYSSYKYDYRNEGNYSGMK